MYCILELKGISKSFKGTKIIDHVNLGVFKGEKHALIGPNGAGKTTLFNLITGKYRPTRGSIIFKEKRIDRYSIYRITQQGIARSFQVTNIFKDMTVYENLRNAVVSRYNCNLSLFPLLNNMDFIDKRVDYFLGKINLVALKHEKAGTLSYGQQRALEMGIAIALEPELVLLDEPTAGMTKEETIEVMELIKQIIENKTMIIIEHDMEVVFNLADRISVLHYGRIIATGTPVEIKQNKQVKDAYLGGLFE